MYDASFWGEGQLYPAVTPTEHKDCHDRTAIRYNKWSSYADGRRGCTTATFLGQPKSYILVLVLIYKCNYPCHQRCVPLKQNEIITTTMAAHAHTELNTMQRSMDCEDPGSNGYSWNTALASMSQGISSERGQNIVGSRVPGSLLWEWLSWKQLHKQDLNNGYIIIHMLTRKAANLLGSHG